MRLHFQKNVLSVKEVEKQPADGHITRTAYHGSHGLRAFRRDAAEEEVGYTSEAHDTLGQINRNRIEPDDAEKDVYKRQAPDSA